MCTWNYEAFIHPEAVCSRNRVFFMLATPARQFHRLLGIEIASSVVIRVMSDLLPMVLVFRQ
jgi:hypothetical protein